MVDERSQRPDDDNPRLPGGYFPGAPSRPGDPGYRMAPWAPDYDPGPNWNNGIGPTFNDPYLQYNNGSPVNAPLTAGHGWEWSGVTSPTWNMSNNQWDYGRWNQVAGRGLGYTETPPPAGGPTTGGAPTGGAPTGGAPTGGPGSVPPLQPGGSFKGPGSTLPGDISALFNKQPSQTPVQSAYQQALLKFMGRSQETPSLSDPTLAPQVEVYRAQQQRNQERGRKVAAERAAATGQSESGYLDNMINQGVQEQGFNTAAFNANLLGGEMNKRREELQAALQLARATGDNEAARELQTRLAQASAAMQQQGLSLQGKLGGGDLALRLMQTLMGNNQFYDQLGVNTALNMEGLNQRAMQFILGL